MEGREDIATIDGAASARRERTSLPCLEGALYWPAADRRASRGGCDAHFGGFAHRFRAGAPARGMGFDFIQAMRGQ